MVAQVKQTHYCRVEGNDKCVVAMTIDMDGVPFSDCFVVEIRWVATRSGKNDLNVQVGLFVNFIKSTMYAILNCAKAFTSCFVTDTIVIIFKQARRQDPERNDRSDDATANGSV